MYKDLLLLVISFSPLLENSYFIKIIIVKNTGLEHMCNNAACH